MFLVFPSGSMEKITHWIPNPSSRAPSGKRACSVHHPKSLKTHPSWDQNSPPFPRSVAARAKKVQTTNDHTLNIIDYCETIVELVPDILEHVMSCELQ
jgi:hypothetical protein